MKERDLSAIGHRFIETPRGEVKYVPDYYYQGHPPVIVDTHIFEADLENPTLGHEGRGVIFNPDESEGTKE